MLNGAKKIITNRGGYMKSLVTVLFGCLLSTAAFADDVTCPADGATDLESSIQWVTDATTCKLAVARAESCAVWGSSADGAIISPASEKCHGELAKTNPTLEEINAMQLMQRLCTAKFPKDGTMWVGPRNFCYLYQVTNLLNLKTLSEAAEQ